MTKICFFIGHRDASHEIYFKLKNVIINHIEAFGVSEFIVGNYGSFDSICAHVLTEIKKDHPFIKLYLLLPYHPSVKRYDIPKGFDGSIYPEGMENVPPRYAISIANKKIIDGSNYLIAYYRYGATNTAGLLEYAKRREKRGFIKITVI